MPDRKYLQITCSLMRWLLDGIRLLGTVAYILVRLPEVSGAAAEHLRIEGSKGTALNSTLSNAESHCAQVSACEMLDSLPAMAVQIPAACLGSTSRKGNIIQLCSTCWTRAFLRLALAGTDRVRKTRTIPQYLFAPSFSENDYALDSRASHGSKLESSIGLDSIEAWPSFEKSGTIPSYCLRGTHVELVPISKQASWKNA